MPALVSALVSVVVLTGGACARDAGDGPDGDPGAGSGVRGVTVVDAGCPPTVEQPACPTGPLAARLEFVAEGASEPTAAVDTAPDGTFSVDLAPGSYDVVPENLTGAPYPRADPVTVEVRPGSFTELTVRFDSGVR